MEKASEETQVPEGWEEARDELRRAYLLVSFGMVDEAIEVCRRADGLIDGGHHLPRTMEGSFLIARGDVTEALKLLRRVTRGNPQAVLPRVHFAEACYSAGRTRQGERALSKARQLDNGEHERMIEKLKETWGELEAAEIPPPVELAVE
jgi:Flp pilus assembly protein TadD